MKKEVTTPLGRPSGSALRQGLGRRVLIRAIGPNKTGASAPVYVQNEFPEHQLVAQTQPT